MRKAFGFSLTLALLGLSLLVSLAGAVPAAAQQQKISREAEEVCFDKLVACVIDCGWWENPSNYEDCNRSCNEDFGICTRGDDVGHLSLHLAPIAPIGEAELERVCIRVNGIYGGASKAFGCMNPQCDEKGNCTVVCHSDKCLATTPDELPDRVTLLGILQNGDMVLRTPNDSTEDGASDGGGNGADDPECGIGGCGPIL